MTIPAFDPSRHYVALPSPQDAEVFDVADPFHPGIAPLAILERRQIVFFHHPDWDGDVWREVLQAYLQAFSADQEVSLVFWLDPMQGVSIEEATRRVLEVMAVIGVSPDEAPDLILVPDVLDLAGLASLYAAADYVLPGEDDVQAGRARKLGRRVVSALSAELLRDVAHSHRGEPVHDA